MVKSQITSGGGGMSTKDIIIYSLLALAIGLGVVSIVFQLTNPLAKGDQGPAGPRGPKGDDGADGTFSEAAQTRIADLETKIGNTPTNDQLKALQTKIDFINIAMPNFVKKGNNYYIASAADGNVLRNENNAVFQNQGSGTNADRNFQMMKFVDAPSTLY
jgi:hypothetical protein